MNLFYFICCRKKVTVTLKNEELAELNTLSKFEVEGITNQDLQDSQNADQTLKLVITKVIARDQTICQTYRMIDGLLLKIAGDSNLLCIPDVHKNTVLYGLKFFNFKKLPESPLNSLLIGVFLISYL